MKEIYQVKIHGRTLESRDLRKLLAMAVSEKRNMDRRMRFYPQLPGGGCPGMAMDVAARPVLS